MVCMNKNILVIEDDTTLGELYMLILTQAGYTAQLAKDGEEGVRLAATKPDLILLDVMLPKLNGIDVLKKLKADEEMKNISVIMLSNLAQDTIIEEALRLGANGYIVKVDMLPKDLLANIESFFNTPPAAPSTTPLTQPTPPTESAH